LTGAVSVSSGVSGAIGIGPGSALLPPAYLVWRTGGLPGGLEPKLRRMSGVTGAVIFVGDTLWMAASYAKTGAVVQRIPAPMGVPLEAFAAEPAAMARFIPPLYRVEVLDAMSHGRAVLGESSAALRHVGVGGRIVLRSGAQITVGAVVPDAVASWSEMLVSRVVAQRLHIVDPQFALMTFAGTPTAEQVRLRVLALLKPGFPIRVRMPGGAEFRRVADTAWPQIVMKEYFGEFVARPFPGRPGYLQMGGTFVRDHLAAVTVPLLGRTTCNRRVFPALIAAMNELRGKGLAGLIHGYAGCYNPRNVNRWPNGPISQHAWGAAVDINAAQNPWGAVPHQDPRLVAIMVAHGFVWGGHFLVPDGMHFSYVGT
jgi:D-alanyl-D-alanine carboxypeptidase